MIDQVIQPSSDSGDSGDRESANIVSVAKSAGGFTTLLAAAEAAGLVNALQEQAVTVLAPTDEAFAKLDPALVKQLLDPANKNQLIDILTYHVIEGPVSAREAIQAGKAKTLQGKSVEFSIVDGRLQVNGTNIIKTDVAAGESVIHAIDEVLIPSTFNPKDLAAATGEDSSNGDSDGDVLVINSSKGNYSKANLVKNRIEITAKSTSRVTLKNVTAKEIRVDGQSAGYITISGQVDRLIVDASGAVTVDASELKAKTVVTDVRGAARVTVAPIDSINASVQGASRVRYVGTPQQVEKTVSGYSSFGPVDHD